MIYITPMAVWVYQNGDSIKSIHMIIILMIIILMIIIENAGNQYMGIFLFIQLTKD